MTEADQIDPQQAVEKIKKALDDEGYQDVDVIVHPDDENAVQANFSDQDGRWACRLPIDAGEHLDRLYAVVDKSRCFISSDPEDILEHGTLKKKRRPDMSRQIEVDHGTPMDLGWYQMAARSTDVFSQAISAKMVSIGDTNNTALQFLRMSYLVTGIAGETGEVLQAWKKYLRGDFDWQELETRMVNELGGTLWYMAMICNEMDLSLPQVAHRNLDKLEQRQDKGTLKGDGDER